MGVGIPKPDAWILKIDRKVAHDEGPIFKAIHVITMKINDGKKKQMATIEATKLGTKIYLSYANAHCRVLMENMWVVKDNQGKVTCKGPYLIY